MCCCLLQESNLTPEKVVKKSQAMELSQKQSIIMEPEEAETGIARMKVTQVMCGFPSNKR